MGIGEFFINLLWIISIDSILGSIIYIGYKYIDLKYFSKLEIIGLKEENNYLKKENKKIGGSSSEFWGDENDN